MARRYNGDLVPIQSGVAHLGVDAAGAMGFDAANISPWGHIHQVSGVFHDPLHGQSGVMRFNQNLACFEISIDGGLTFECLVAGGLSNIGVLGGADLTGAVDITSTSGFVTIGDTAGASPLTFDVDIHGLSGLWDFPSQGFNGRVVNALTDFNGTEVDGVVNVVGASGVVVDIIGQTMTVTLGNNVPRCYAETFTAATSWTITHNLGTSDVSVQVLDDSTPRTEIGADDITVTDANTVTVSFNIAQAGRAVIFGC